LYPRPPQRDTVSGRAILNRAVVQIEDVLADREFHRDLALTTGWRSMVAVPMLREGDPIGAIVINRIEPGPFSDNHIELLKTFADQAVIAIENVRLFTELQASNRELTTALDKQTATSDILRIIAGSQTNVQPVFDAIVASAVRLLGGYTSSLSRVIDNHVALVALTSSHDEADAALRARFPQPLDSREAHAQTIRARAPLNIADAVNDPRLPEVQQTSARARGFRSLVLVPLLHQDAAIGAIGVSRREPGGFTGDEIALLQTFADQAVIAIENVHLFTELQEKNRALTDAHAQVTEALEQQTATSEILRVISASQTNLQPVFEAIVRSAAQLCEATFAVLHQFDGHVITFEVHHGMTEQEAEGARHRFPLPTDRGTAVGRAILDRRTTHINDIRIDAENGVAGRQE